MEGPLYRLLISSRSINKHGQHRQLMFMIACFLKKNLFFCGKRDNSNLNIDIYFSIIQLNESVFFCGKRDNSNLNIDIYV